MSASEGDMREGFRRQLRFEVGLIDELVDMRMSGYEPPLNAAVVQAAAKRVEIRLVLDMARQDGRWMLAWFLTRYLATVRPASGRHAEREWG